MLKFIIFFFFVCFAVWGIFYGVKELVRDPETGSKILGRVAIGILICIVAAFIVSFFVMVF